MALSYYYHFSAPQNVSAENLEAFLRKVEAKAKVLGFDPTIVIGGPFATEEQKQFARRITTGLVIADPRLKGVSLLDTSCVWNYDPTAGECRVIPEQGVLLVVTNERGDETAFGFLRYPTSLRDLNGKEIVAVPQSAGWVFRDFVDTPDPRYRSIVKMFADAGFLESEKDEYVS